MDNKWRLSPDWPGQRCCAKTRKGTVCQKPPIKGKTRCRLHGGLSTGPRTVEGKARICGCALEAWATLKGVHRGPQADMGGSARSRGSDAR
ncbi:MAG: HGGxSTG domain-containing protein [Flavobacteriales bacterium]